MGANTPGGVAGRLLRSSARHSYDPEVDIDWSAPIDPTLWGMQPERMSLYGTHLWDRMTEESASRCRSTRSPRSRAWVSGSSCC